MKLKNFFSKAKDGIKSLFKGKRKFATIAVILVVAIVFGYVGIFEKKEIRKKNQDTPWHRLKKAI